MISIKKIKTMLPDEPKLSDLLAVIDDNTIFYLGVKTNYIFVGNKKTFEADKQLLNEKFSCKFSYLYQSSILLLKKYKEEKERYTLLQRVSDYNIVTAKIKRLTHRKSELKEALLKSVPFEDRKVLDFYPRLSSDGLCIIIEGQEQGTIWTLEEYLSCGPKEDYKYEEEDAGND